LCASLRENEVPEGFFRTWVERYQVDDQDMEDPLVDSPNGGKNGFPALAPGGGPAGSFKEFFVPKLCNHCADSPCTQVCPVARLLQPVTAWCL